VQNALEIDPTTLAPSGEYECLGSESNPPSSPGCAPLNIFNGLGSSRLEKDGLAYSTASGFQEGWTEESILSGSITGDLGAWGGQSPWAKNPIAVSFGSEYRQERLELSTDNEFCFGTPATTDLYGQGGPTCSVAASGFNVTEGFTEVKVPLIQEMPFIEDLTFNGGYRYSSYNVAGATNTWKAGVEWQPIDDLRFRVSQNHAVRAPNVLELFAGAAPGLFSGQDPCSGGANGGTGPTPNEAAACVAATGGAHVAPGNVGSGLLTCPATQCNQIGGGNVHLKPEVSDTRTAGIVFTPTFIDGFNATVDYFDIKVAGFISPITPTTTLDQCYNNGTPVPNGFFCNFVHRNAFDQIFGSGEVSDQVTNTGFLSTSGIDFETSYTTDLANVGLPNLGSIAMNLKGTWLDTLNTSVLPGFSAFNCAGQFGLVCGTPNPKWRHYFRTTWSTPWDVDFSVAWRYIGAVGLDADTSDIQVGGAPGGYLTCPNGVKIQGVGDCWDSRLSSYSYFDLAFDWTVREGVDLHGGVNNVLGTDPPVIGTQALPLGVGNGNTFAGVYDTLGREFFLGATIKY